MHSTWSLAWCCFLAGPFVARPSGLAHATIRVETPVHAPATEHHWMQARAGIVPLESRPPRVVMTLQLHDNVGTHMYHGPASMKTDDGGARWTAPEPQAKLARRTHENGLIEVLVDATPAWHAPSHKLLLTGATFWLDPKIKKHTADGGSDVAYAVYDAEQDQWKAWRKLKLPDHPRFRYARAGCTQRYDLPNGDILLPIYFDGRGNDSRHRATVVRCRFDGETLTYLEHGDELSLDVERGFVEPSLTRFGDIFYLTLRNDQQAYVTTGQDGLHFDTPQPWRFEDGQALGSYNTQQHWIPRPDGLFLAYTRRGADNDDIFRHRAPLFIAQVDPATLRVRRDTERVLLPKLQGGFGNFGVCEVAPEETWVIAGRRAAKPGEPSVYLARIRWKP